MIIYLSLLISLVGYLMYALCVNPKLSEIGRMMFWTGLLAFLLRVVAPAIGVLR
jgi:Na+/phosphate symporter